LRPTQRRAADDFVFEYGGAPDDDYSFQAYQKAGKVVNITFAALLDRRGGQW